MSIEGIDLQNLRLINVGDPEANTDGVNMTYMIKSTGSIITPAMYNDDVQTAVTAAYESNRPFYIDSGTAYVDLVFDTATTNTAAEANYKVLMDATKWHSKCVTRGTGEIVLRMPAGLSRLNAHTPNGHSIPVTRIFNTSPPLILEASGSATELVITDINLGTKVGNSYPLEIVVSSAISNNVANGYALGLKNITGDNDAGALHGGMVVENISNDRLTISGTFVSTRTPDLVAPTTIDSSTAWYGLAASRLVVPSSCIAFDVKQHANGYPQWTGSDYEGFFNIEKGGQAETRKLAISWVGPPVGTTGYAQDFFFVRDSGSRFYAGPSTVLVGAPADLIRMYGHGASAIINQACLGGGKTGQDGIIPQAGAGYEIIRSSIGGFARRLTSLGDSCKATTSISCLGSAPTIVETVNPNSGYSLGTTKIEGGARGVHAVAGTITLGTDVRIRNCQTPIDWSALGFVRGACTLEGNLTTPTENQETGGGGWFANTTANIVQPITDPAVTLLYNQTAVFEISGVGGRIEMVCSNSPGCSFSLDVHVSSPTTVFEAVDYGSNVVVSSGTLSSVPINPGKVSFSVYLSGGVYYLVILNESTSSKTFYVKPSYGNVTLGTAVINGAATTVGSNILFSPREISNATNWTTGGSGATVVADANTSLDGNLYADRLTDSSNTATSRRQQTVAVTNNAIYEASILMKADTFDIGTLEITEGTRRVVLSLANGSYSANNFDVVVVTSLPDGWYQLNTRYTSSSANATFRIYPAYTDTITQTANLISNGSIYVDMASLAPVT